MQDATRQVLVLLEKNKLHEALKLIHDTVEKILTEPLCTAQVFFSRQLDSLCTNIGKRVWTNLSFNKKCSPIDEKNAFIYIVTKLHKSGGHTKLIENFIRSRPDNEHIILSTELNGKIEKADIPLLKLPNVILESAPKNNFYHKLIWLQTRLITHAPIKVFLFNHHQDSIAVAAIQPEMNLETFFCHHGDHHLCLGVSLPYVKHIDFHPASYFYCKEHLNFNNSYIPLIVKDKGSRPNDMEFMKDGQLVTCTAARSNKVEVPYYISYINFIPKLLKATNGKHVHLGKLTRLALLRIKLELKKQRICSSKFIYIPYVASVWETLHKYNIDLYIGSFPQGGGLTLIEAMGAGIPVCIHSHIYSRFLGGIDLAPPTAFIWRQLDELINYCQNLTISILESNSRMVRQHYEKHHSDDSVYAADFYLNPPDLYPNFIKEEDSWAHFMVEEISLQHLFLRAVYRFLRKLKTCMV